MFGSLWLEAITILEFSLFKLFDKRRQVPVGACVMHVIVKLGGF